MTFVWLLPAILSLIAIGAHCFRAGNYLGMAVVLGLVALLAVRKSVAARAVQLGLLFGAALWIRTAFRIRAVRIEDGQPWMRMAIILGAVAVITALSGLSFRSARLKRWFRMDAST